MTTTAPGGGLATRGPGSPVRRVLVFFALAYAISWAWVVPLVLTGRTVEQGRGWPTHLPSLVGPLLAALLVTAGTTGRRGLRELLGRMVRWRIGLRWWIAALGPLLFTVVALGVLAALGAPLPAPSGFAGFSGVPSALGPVGVAAVIVLVNGFGEEAGWRGYALPCLQERFGPGTATLLVAAGWAGWHVPQFFLLASYRDFAAPMLLVFLVGLACGAVVLTWLFDRTGGSVLAVAVWHGLYNLTGGTAAAGAHSGLLAALVWTFVVAHAAVLLVLEHRARRAGTPSVLGPR